jgi:protein CpxP
MRTLSRISFLVIGATLCMGVAAKAQTPDQTAPAQQPPAGAPMHHGHHGPNADRQAHFLSKKLNLTPDQEAQVKPILAERDQKMKALRGSDANMTVEQAREQRKAIMADSMQKMNGILNDTQKQQLAEMKSERGHHHGQWQHGAQPAPAPAA